ncbi:NAD(P)-dependent oxidoreductase [Kribbella sp. NPDC000426]|uniref:NAD-dependent epimerase/dehydratase family protein n=1 Tax=Kribbella sp. NPDC000426 TaxID=3154255 RepID=UPI003327B0A3
MQRHSETPRRLLVTGAAGKLGTVVTARFLQAGAEVVAVDRVAPAAGVAPGVTPVLADLTDAAAVRAAIAGCDAVIHVAKYGGPSDTDQFAVNTSATYNVLAAAAAEGVEHAVIGSSVCAYGTTFAKRPFSPVYAPVDEDHPLTPQDSYSLSKVVDEATARAFVDGYGMNVVALRFHWLAELEEVRASAARLAALGEPVMSRDLWCYTEINDAARACELGLGVSDGFHALNICSTDSLSEVPTEQLLARFHPETEIRRPIEGTASAWSMDRAREVLNFVPENSWRSRPVGVDR